jgi:hypothetical protein
VIRDQKTRRRVMVMLLMLALLLLISGGTFLAPFLNPRHNLAWALTFWIVCIWLTLAAMLLAIFDLIAVRRNGQHEERALRKQFKESARPGDRGTGKDDLR